MNLRTLRSILNRIGKGWHDECPALIDVDGRTYEIEGVTQGTARHITIDAKTQLAWLDRHLPSSIAPLPQRQPEIDPLTVETLHTKEASD